MTQKAIAAGSREVARNRLGAHTKAKDTGYKITHKKAAVQNPWCLLCPNIVLSRSLGTTVRYFPA